MSDKMQEIAKGIANPWPDTWWVKSLGVLNSEILIQGKENLKIYLNKRGKHT